MPYGLTGAPATFKSTMNSILAPYLRKFVLVFVDDIFIYSATPSDHLKHLKLVFDTLEPTSAKGESI